MKTGRFPWFARLGQTFDPKSVNENFRKGADYIRDALKMRYTYSLITYNLTDLDLDLAAHKHRFIFYPGSPMDIVGAELVAAGYAEGESIYVRWVGPDEVASVQTTSTSGVATGTTVVLPNGGPTASWRWLEAKGSDNFDLAEDINQRALRVGDPAPLGANIIAIEGDSALAASGKSATLNVWIRQDRGTDPDFEMPELFNGTDPADANKFNDIVAELQTQRTNAVGNLNTRRCEVIMATGGMGATGVGAANSPMQTKMNSTIPSPTTSDGDWKLKRIDTGFVAKNASFAPGFAARRFQTEIFKGGATVVTQETALGDTGGPTTYNEIYRWGDTLAPQDLTDPAAASVTLPVEDNTLVNTELDPVAIGHDIETIYYYMWYSLE